LEHLFKTPPATHLRHHEIKDDQINVRLLPGVNVQGLVAVRSRDDGVARPLKNPFAQVSDMLFGNFSKTPGIG